MTNRASSFGMPSSGPLHRHGGKITALGELPIHALGDDYTVDGNGGPDSCASHAAAGRDRVSDDDWNADVHELGAVDLSG